MRKFANNIIVYKTRQSMATIPNNTIGQEYYNHTTNLLQLITNIDQTMRSIKIKTAIGLIIILFDCFYTCYPHK